jgi:hypothetical protein
MNSIKKVTFNDNNESLKDNLVNSININDIDENLYKNIFKEIDAFDNFHTDDKHNDDNHNYDIYHIDSDDEYQQNMLKKENDLNYESSDNEDISDLEEYDHLDCLEIDDIDKKNKYILGYKEFITIKSSNNDQIIDNKNDQIIENNNNNNKIIENNNDDFLDDILDKIDLDENNLDEIIKNNKDNITLEEDNVEEDEIIYNEEDQEKKNNFDISVSYNTFKNRYKELCEGKKDKIIYNLFKILITNNPNKNLEFYVNFVKSIIMNDKQ